MSFGFMNNFVQASPFSPDNSTFAFARVSKSVLTIAKAFRPTRTISGSFAEDTS
jgi:hypothetical protein